MQSIVSLLKRGYSATKYSPTYSPTEVTLCKINLSVGCNSGLVLKILNINFPQCFTYFLRSIHIFFSFRFKSPQVWLLYFPNIQIFYFFLVPILCLFSADFVVSYFKNEVFWLFVISETSSKNHSVLLCNLHFASSAVLLIFSLFMFLLYFIFGNIIFFVNIFKVILFKLLYIFNVLQW